MTDTNLTLPDDALIILPVRSVVLFPGIVMPLSIGRERSRAAVQEAPGEPPKARTTSGEPPKGPSV